MVVLLVSSTIVAGADPLGGDPLVEEKDLGLFAPEEAVSKQTTDLEEVYQALGGVVAREDLISCMGEDGCRDRLEWVLWTQSVPLEALEQNLVSQAPGVVEHGLPTPPKLPDYPFLSDAEKREAWRAWYLFSSYEASKSDVLGADPFGPYTDSTASPAGAGGADDHDASQSPGDGPGPARDLRGLWRLEGHGYPLQVIPGSGDGDYYLLTTQGLMHFPEPAERPDWMVRSTSWVMKAEPVFTSAGELEKIVIGTYPSIASDDPSIIVVDPDGHELSSGLVGSERLSVWSLTDVDGDGEQDVIGRDLWGRAVAMRLDGSLIYREVIESPLTTGSLPGVPLLLSLYYFRNGMDPYGDVDGDGVLDFVVSGEYWTFGLLLSYDIPMVQVYSGKDLQEIWTYVDQPSDFIAWLFVLGAGDMTGDGRAEVLIDYFRWTSLPIGSILSEGALVLSGEDGTPVIRDDETYVCTVTCAPVDLKDYQPVALVDFDGNGRHLLVGAMEIWSADGLSSLDIVLREPGAVPGGPSEEVDAHSVSLAGDGVLLGGDMRLRPAPNGAQALWIDIYYAKEEGDDRVITSEHHVLGPSGLTSREAEQGMGLVDQDPSTGTFYGWRHMGDRWVSLDEELEAQGDGIGLVVDVVPMLYHDINGDRVPDALLDMTIGYRWVSGRTGEQLGLVDSLAGNWLSRVAYQDGEPAFLEYDPFEEGYTLYSIEREAFWSHDPEDHSVFSLADVTGNGLLELLVRESGTTRFTDNGIVYDPGKVIMLDMPDKEALWSTEYDWGDSLYIQDLLPKRQGLEMLLGKRGEDYWDLELTAYVWDEDESLWSAEREQTQLRAVGAGAIVLSERSWNHDDADRLEFLEAATGETTFEFVLPQNEKEGWSRYSAFAALVDMTRNGTADLVYSYRDTHWQTEKFEQTLLVLDLAGGTKSMEYRLFDPQVIDYGGWRSVRGPGIYGEVGDWDQDGVTDLRLEEHGSPIVRSGADGEVLAVGPRGSFESAIDLNGDGRKEVALMQTGRLRMMMYAAGAGEIVEGNGTVERVTNPDEVHRMEEGAKDAFDTKGLPAPAVPLLLVLVGAWLALRRRRD